MTATVTTTPATKPKPTPEMIRQAVLADQAAARADVAAARTKTSIKTAKVKAPKTTVPAKAAKPADTRKIIVLAKSNPHAAGSRRADWFKQLKNGMTVDNAVKTGVRAIYLERMAAKGVVKIG
jgi:hypothetical protein